MILFLTGTEDGEPYTDGGFFLCSATAWSRFSSEFEKQATEYFPKVRELTQTGTCKDSWALCTELGGLIDSGRLSPHVAATAQALLDKIEIGDEEETVRVIDEDNVAEEDEHLLEW